MKMRLTEKHRPNKLSKIIGNDDKLKDLERAVKNETPVLLWGLPGVGKTSAAKAIGDELKLDTFYHNASDKRKRDDSLNLLRQARTVGLDDSLIILDEIDGFRNWSILKKIVNTNNGAIILIANDMYKIPKDVRDLTNIIEFKAPYVRSVRKHIKEIAKNEGLDYKEHEITRDVRSSINTLLGGSKFEIAGQFDVVRQVLGDGNIKHFDFKEHSVWLLENFGNMYNGRKIYDAVRVLNIALRLKNKKVLKYLPRGKGNVEYPVYFRMLKASREKRL